MKSLFHLSLFAALAVSQAAQAEERATINDLKDVFAARGTVSYSYVGDKATASIEMDPSAWLDEPANFGASGLRLSIFFEGDTALMMSGTPTAEGCHGMMLSAVPNM